MRYQTRVDSDDDWESVVLNLVRRPSGIAWEYVKEGEGRTKARLGEKVIYTPEDMLLAKPSLTRLSGERSVPRCSGTCMTPSVCRSALNVGGNSPPKRRYDLFVLTQTNSDATYLASKQDRKIHLG